MKKHFGEQARSPRELIIKDWKESVFISPSNVAELTEYQLFGSPFLRAGYFDNRLYFTSTETAVDTPGHIQGALSAARRTADQISKLQN